MESKVAKNTDPKPTNFKVVFNCLSIKRLLERQISASVILLENQVNIAPRCISFTDINQKNADWHRLKLTHFGYRCAIAYPLAAQLKLPVIDVVQYLAHYLSSLKQEVNDTQVLDFEIQVIKPGFLDFHPRDRTLAIWLQQLLSPEVFSRDLFLPLPSASASFIPCETEKPNYLLPVQYVHARCGALLQLGNTEGLIELEQQNLTSMIGQWLEPNPIPWLHPETTVFQLQHPSEQILINQFLNVIDNYTYSDSPNWVQIATNLSAAMLDFYRNCRIWGETTQNTPLLAQARLGLVAICQILLEQILPLTTYR